MIPIVNKNLSSVTKLGKDTNTMDWTNVVYKSSRKNYEACYISETKRSIKTRINEHINDKNNQFVVSQPQINLNHKFDWYNLIAVDSKSYNKQGLSQKWYT